MHKRMRGGASSDPRGDRAAGDRDAAAAKELVARGKGIRPAAASLASAARSVGRAAREAQERVAGGLRPAAKTVGQALGRGLSATAKAARRSGQIGVLRARIVAQQVRIHGLYSRIGEAYYKGLKNPATRSAGQRAIKPLVQKVDQLHEKISALRESEKAARAAR